MSTSPAASARALTARLLSRELASATSPNAAANAAHVACERSLQALIGWLGNIGAEMLLSRALTQARASYPALNGITIRARPDLGLNGVAEGIQEHGGAMIAEGLEAVLLAMIVLLVRLLGNKMTAQLLESSGSNGTTEAENQKV